ncbi:MAG: hypothetical protein AB7W47_18125 [Calditrichaceae bacterium]
MERKQLLGVIGSVLLGISVFMPIIRIPLVGNLNYIQDGKGEGIAILILAVVSLIFVILRKYKFLWLSGAGGICILLFSYLNIKSKISQFESELDSELAKNILRGITDIAIESIQIEWGLFVMIAAIVLLFLASSLKK